MFDGAGSGLYARWSSLSLPKRRMCSFVSPAAWDLALPSNKNILDSKTLVFCVEWSISVCGVAIVWPSVSRTFPVKCNTLHLCDTSWIEMINWNDHHWSFEKKLIFHLTRTASSFRGLLPFLVLWSGASSASI